MSIRLVAVQFSYKFGKKIRKNPAETDTVLRSPLNGKSYDSDGKALYRRLNALGKRLGIQDVRPHRFRCSFAVDALLKGASVKQIAEWLGDKPETVSAHYLPMSEAMSEQTRNLLGRKDAGIEAMTGPEPDQAAEEPVFARKIRSIA
jgi:integrase